MKSTNTGKSQKITLPHLGLNHHVEGLVKVEIFEFDDGHPLKFVRLQEVVRLKSDVVVRVMPVEDGRLLVDEVLEEVSWIKSKTNHPEGLTFEVEVH